MEHEAIVMTAETPRPLLLATQRDGAHCDVPWRDAIPEQRPAGEWAYYRNGIIHRIPENEARETFDCWKYLSCDRGASLFMIDQLWNEIDQLRAEVAASRRMGVHPVGETL